MERKKYNGWCNYETWCYNLHLTSDYRFYENLEELKNEDIFDIELSRKWKQVIFNSEYLIEFCNYFLFSEEEEDNLPGIMSDFFHASMKEVNFQEIFESLFEEKIEELKAEI